MEGREELAGVLLADPASAWDYLKHWIWLHISVSTFHSDSKRAQRTMKTVYRTTPAARR